MGLSAVQQKDIYDEIVRLYDFTEEIINAIEDHFNDDVTAAHFEIEAATPLIEELQNCADVMTQTYVDFVENNQKAKKSQIFAVESAIRKVFTKAWELIDVIKGLPENVQDRIQDVKDGLLTAAKKVKEGILPTIEELVTGPTHNTLEKLIGVYKRHKALLKAVQENLAHLFRLTYRLAAADIGLVINPRHAIPGRTAPDLEAQKNQEHKKSKEKKEKDLTRAENASQLVDKYNAKGDSRLD